MLTAAQFDELVTPLTEFWQEYTNSVINDIARRLAKLGDPTKVTATAAWQAQRLSESGLLYEEILKKVSAKTGISQQMLRKAFRDAGVKTMQFDDAIYKAAGLNPAPLNLSPAMLQVLQVGLTRTNGIVENFTRTTALAGQQSFLRASDLAYQQVVTGAFDYGTAIKTAVKRVSSEGLRVISYAGHTDQLDVAMRRAVLTGVAQTTGALQLTRAEELKVDLVQTSAHIGARETHIPWQGRIFSRSGNSDKYPDFLAETGYGTVEGLMGINCRHSFFPFFEGLSENAYKQATLDEYANKTVTYNGEEVPIYEATQKQRYIERNIRKWKREADALNAAGMDNSFELERVKMWQAKARDFVKQTGLPRQGAREQIVKIAESVSPKKIMPPVFDPSNKKQVLELLDTYTSSKGLEINGRLREEGFSAIPSEQQKIVRDLDRLIKENGSITTDKTNLTVYRGFADSRILEQGIISDRAFVSTSTSREIAEDFGDVIKIEIEEGVPYYRVPAEIFDYDQKEILFPRGMQFWKNPNGVWTGVYAPWEIGE